MVEESERLRQVNRERVAASRLKNRSKGFFQSKEKMYRYAVLLAQRRIAFNYDQQYWELFRKISLTYDKSERRGQIQKKVVRALAQLHHDEYGRYRSEYYALLKTGVKPKLPKLHERTAKKHQAANAYYHLHIKRAASGYMEVDTFLEGLRQCLTRKFEWPT